MAESPGTRKMLSHARKRLWLAYFETARLQRTADLPCNPYFCTLAMPVIRPEASR